MSAIISWKGRVRAVVVGRAVRFCDDLAERPIDDPDVVWTAALAQQALAWPEGVAWDTDLAARAARRALMESEIVVGCLAWCQDSRQLSSLLGVPVDVVADRTRDQDVRGAVSRFHGRHGRVRGPRRGGDGPCGRTVR